MQKIKLKCLGIPNDTVAHNLSHKCVVVESKPHNQCDQIGRFIVLWATIQSLWQHLIYPNLLPSYAIFVTISKSFIFLVKSFLSGHTAHNPHTMQALYCLLKHLRMLWVVVVAQLVEQSLLPQQKTCF